MQKIVRYKKDMSEVILNTSTFEKYFHWVAVRLSERRVGVETARQDGGQKCRWLAALVHFAVLENCLTYRKDILILKAVVPEDHDGQGGGDTCRFYGCH
jgi:hypothetical protein